MPSDNVSTPPTTTANHQTGNNEHEEVVSMATDDTGNMSATNDTTSTSTESENAATDVATTPTADVSSTTSATSATSATPTATSTESVSSANGANGANSVDGSSAAQDTAQDTMQDVMQGSGAFDDMPDMSEMERLLTEQDAQFKSIKRGDVVEGQIVHMDSDEILVDIGLKSEGVLTTKELPNEGYGSLAELHVGDTVLVYIMQPETPEGHAIVSIRRARQERQWRIAQEQFERGDLLEAQVIDYNKGGLIVNLEGIRGFVPISQILNLKREDNADNAETQTKLQGMVGRKLQLKIIEINRNRNRLILSERLAVQEWRTRRREELLNELQVNEVRTGVVSNLANFGAFVDLGGADGLVHISQLAWSRVNHPSEVLKVGQKVEVQVLSVDKERKKIALSIKRAEVDPWTTVEQRYVPGQLVKGTITKIAPFGAFSRIEDGVEGLIHLSELPVGTSDPKQVLKEGEEVTVRILRIDPERRRLGLSLRQADEAAVAVEPAPTPSAQVATQGEAVAEAAPTVTSPEAPTPAEAAASRQRPTREEQGPTTAMAAAFQAAFGNQQSGADTAEDNAQPATANPAAKVGPTTQAASEAAAPADEGTADTAGASAAKPAPIAEPTNELEASSTTETVDQDSRPTDPALPTVKHGSENADEASSEE